MLVKSYDANDESYPRDDNFDNWQRTSICENHACANACAIFAYSFCVAIVCVLVVHGAIVDSESR